MIIISSSALSRTPHFEDRALMERNDLKVLRRCPAWQHERAAAEFKHCAIQRHCACEGVGARAWFLLFQRHARGVKITPAGAVCSPFGTHNQAA